LGKLFTHMCLRHQAV